MLYNFRIIIYSGIIFVPSYIRETDGFTNQNGTTHMSIYRSVNKVQLRCRSMSFLSNKDCIFRQLNMIITMTLLLLL